MNRPRFRLRLMLIVVGLVASIAAVGRAIFAHASSRGNVFAAEVDVLGSFFALVALAAFLTIGVLCARTTS